MARIAGKANTSVGQSWLKLKEVRRILLEHAGIRSAGGETTRRRGLAGALKGLF